MGHCVNDRLVRVDKGCNDTLDSAGKSEIEIDVVGTIGEAMLNVVTVASDFTNTVWAADTLSNTAVGPIAPPKSNVAPVKRPRIVRVAVGDMASSSVRAANPSIGPNFTVGIVQSMSEGTTKVQFEELGALATVTPPMDSEPKLRDKATRDHRTSGCMSYLSKLYCPNVTLLLTNVSAELV